MILTDYLTIRAEHDFQDLFKIPRNKSQALGGICNFQKMLLIPHCSRSTGFI